MKTLNKRELFLLITTVSLATFFVVVQFIVKPFFNDSSDAEREIKSTQVRLLKARQTIAAKEKIDGRYDQLLEIFGKSQSESIEKTTMISRIQVAASESAVQISNMQPQRAVKRNSMLLYPVELQISGKWDAILKFLHALQKDPNYYLINELNIERSADSQGGVSGRIVMSKMRLAG